MIINRLTLTNYRRFRRLDLELPENLIGIVGQNGTGKTTLVEAIGWALYGNKIRRSDKQDVRSQFAESKEACTVELEFILGGVSYRVARQLKGKNAIAEAAIYRAGNPEPEAVQESGVNDYVESLLALDYRSFFVSVFARQKDLAALSALSPEDRRKSISRLMNIDVIEKIRVQIRSDQRDKAAQQQGMQATLQDEKVLKERRKEIKNQIAEKKTALKDLEAQLKAAQEKLVGNRTKFDILSTLRDQHNHLTAQVDKWQHRLVDFENRCKQLDVEIKQIDEQQVELEKMQPMLQTYDQVKAEKERLDVSSRAYVELKAKQDERERATSQLVRLQAELETLQKSLTGVGGMEEQIATVDIKVETLEKEREQTRQKLTAAEAELKKIETIGKDLGQRKKNIENIGSDSPCPVCTRPLGEHYDDVVLHFETELNGLRAQYKTYDADKKKSAVRLDELRATIQEINKQRNELVRKQEQFTERSKQVDKAKQDVARWEKNLAELEEAIKSIGDVNYDEAGHKQVRVELEKLGTLREQAIKYQEHINRLPAVLHELQDNQTTVKELSADIDAHKKQLTELKFNPEEYDAVKNEMTTLQEDVDKHRELVEASNRTILGWEKDLEKIDADINRQKQLLADIQELQEEIVYLKTLDDHFGTFRRELTGRIRPLIAQRTSELLHLTTNGRYSLLELDDDYNIYLYDQSERFPLARFSGGEQDLANLCLRIAISQVVAERAGGRQINFIVLDEIFGSQDASRKELILNTLQKLSTQFRQIFVITHIDDIKDVMPVLISVASNGRDESVAVLR
ncbi:SMC family ATPase [candidate division KSB1 bacterium]|nr:SMC family ATPase [candidate division KSB1 bacterium]